MYVSRRSSWIRVNFYTVNINDRVETSKSYYVPLWLLQSNITKTDIFNEAYKILKEKGDKK